MHETICTFPSKTLYGGRLRSDAVVARHLLQDLENIKPPSGGGNGATDDDELLRTPVVFFDTAGCEYFEKSGEAGEGDEGSKCNENEATLVKNWVVKLVRCLDGFLTYYLKSRKTEMQYSGNRGRPPVSDCSSYPVSKLLLPVYFQDSYPPRADTRHK